MEVRRFNVFTPEEAATSFFPYGLANALHRVTREWFVRRELLFVPGDPLDPAILAETERLLRASRLFRRASVRPEADGNVVVETQDAWTLLPKGSFSKKGTTYSWSVGLEETNVLGTGRGLSFLYDSGIDRLSRSVAYFDPQFVWRHTSFQLSASDLSDGRTFETGLARPFYSLAAPWAAFGFYRNARYDTKLYTRGVETTTWKKWERTFQLQGGWLDSTRSLAVIRPYLLAEWSDVLLTDEGKGGPPPEPSERRFLWVGGGVERAEPGWIVRRQVEQIDRDEDFNLALSGSTDVSLSPPSVGGSLAALRLRAGGGFGTLLPRGFAVFSGQAEARYAGKVENVRFGVDARAYGLAPPWTVLLRAGAAGGWRADPEVQYYLDPTSGLRGYELWSVAGTGRAVLNAEARLLLATDVLHLVSFAVAGFADAGVAWGPPDGTWRLADAGIGVRFGLSRAAKNTLIRLDLSRTLHPDPQGRGGWLLSFSSGAAF